MICTVGYFPTVSGSNFLILVHKYLLSISALTLASNKDDKQTGMFGLKLFSTSDWKR